MLELGIGIFVGVGLEFPLKKDESCGVTRSPDFFFLIILCSILIQSIFRLIKSLWCYQIDFSICILLFWFGVDDL